MTVELDATYLPVAGRSRQEQYRWGPTAIALGVNHAFLNGLHVGGGDPLARAKKAVAALRFASESPIADIEAELMQLMRSAAAAGPIRAVAGRTRDVVDAVATICRVRGYQLPDVRALSNLGTRLEIGLPAQIGDLAVLFGARLSRVQYLELHAKGLHTPEALTNADEEIRVILGEGLAAEIRQAVEPADG